MFEIFDFISSLFNSNDKNNSHLNKLHNGAAIKCESQTYIKLDIEMGGIIPYRDYIILLLD